MEAVPRALRVAPGLAGSGAPNCIAEAGERWCKRARRDADAVAEWGDMLYYRCKASRTIVRAGYGGIHGGWVYATVGSLLIDWSEIEHVARRLGGEVTDLRRNDG